MNISGIIGLVAMVVAAALAGGIEYQSRFNVVTAGFWFDDSVTFELHDTKRLGGPLTAQERRTIANVARAEIAHAFSNYRIVVTDRRDAFYRVRVLQRLHGRIASSGQSNVWGPLGGDGAVSFITLSAQAMYYAPAGARRDDIVEAIGRGIGRAAVHEFTHQILPKGPVHTSTDRASYEFWSSDRPAQYYGEMRWSVARDTLQERLGR
jgi:hypothetical protein